VLSVVGWGVLGGRIARALSVAAALGVLAGAAGCSPASRQGSGSLAGAGETGTGAEAGAGAGAGAGAEAETGTGAEAGAVGCPVDPDGVQQRGLAAPVDLEGWPAEVRLRMRVRTDGAIDCVYLVGATRPGFAGGCKGRLVGGRRRPKLDSAGVAIDSWLTFLCQYERKGEPGR